MTTSTNSNPALHAHYEDNIKRLYSTYKRTDSIEALLEECKSVVIEDGQPESHAMVLLNKVVGHAIRQGVPQIAEKLEVITFDNLRCFFHWIRPEMSLIRQRHRNKPNRVVNRLIRHL